MLPVQSSCFSFLRIISFSFVQWKGDYIVGLGYHLSSLFLSREKNYTLPLSMGSLRPQQGMTYVNQRAGMCGRDYSLSLSSLPFPRGSPRASWRKLGSQEGSFILPSSEQELWCEKGREWGEPQGALFSFPYISFSTCSASRKNCQEKEQSRLVIAQ